MLHRGSCHCGGIAFEVEGNIEGATACNCSMCQRKGVLMWFVPRDALRVSTPQANISTYTFNKHVIRHNFCPTCGIHAFGDVTDAKGNRMAAVNLRCVTDIDLDAIPVSQFDGRSV